MVLAKVQLAAAAVLAVCAAVAFIAMTLAGPSGRLVQEIDPRSQQAPSSEAKAPIVLKTDRGIPENPPPIPAGESGNRPVTRPERRLSPLGENVERAIRGGVRFLKGSNGPTATGPTSRPMREPVSPAWSPWPCCRPARSPTHPVSARRSSTSAVSVPMTCARPTRSRCKPGLRRRRTRPRSVADRRQRRVAGAGPDPSRGPGLMARLVELLRFQASQAR